MQKGQIIAGEFMLQRLVSDGPDGEVWRALESNVGRLVQLRFIPDFFQADPRAMDRLRRHVATLRTFKHPHVVQVERLVEQSDTGAFLVSRFVDGPLLDEYAAQWIQAEGRFPFNLIFDVLRPIAYALDEAKGLNLAHRALSPRRVVVSQTEGLQILDFDLAGIIREKQGEEHPERVFGDTEQLRYMAPEQILGEFAGSLSDQYSFATIIAELLANRPLFPASQAEELRTKILLTPTPVLVDQPDHVNASLQRALYKTPSVRFPSNVHFLDGLAGLVAVAFPPPYVPSETVRVRAAQPIQPVFNAFSSVIISPSVAAQEMGPISPVSSSPNEEKVVPEQIVSFDKISSAARTATAKKIAGKIKKERRIQHLFYVWNTLLLLCCLIVIFMFRERIGLLWKQRVQGETITETQVFEPEQGVSERGDDNARPVKKQIAPRSRRSTKQKEEDFTDSKESPFKKFGDDDQPDEVRFIGTSGVGKKIVFVIDASAAMGTGKFSPWSYAQDELAFSFHDMNPSQWFQVIYFSDRPNLLPDGQGPEEWIPVSPDSLKKACAFLKTVDGSGLSQSVKALEKAFSLRPDLIFFLTDQKCVTLTAGNINDLKHDAGNVIINAVEIGEGPDAPAASPIQTLAETFRGEYRWVNGNLRGLKR